MNVFVATSRQGDTLIFSEDEAWHCSKVLRMQPGSQIIALDGCGSRFLAQLNRVNDKQCMAEIISVEQVEKRKQSLHLAISPTKNIDRMEWMVEKATELGIEEISFIWCKNSERKQIKTERLQRVAMSAVKQSMQVFFPTIHEPISFSQFLEKWKNSNANKLIAHCFPEVHRTNLSEIESSAILAMIGPEGDFTPQEIENAIQSGFRSISLGESRLRTETAGVYLAAYYHNK